MQYGSVSQTFQGPHSVKALSTHWGSLCPWNTELSSEPSGVRLL